jgi:trigger factor
MNSNIQHKSSVEATIKVSVPKPVVSERMNSFFATLAKRAKVPGFRPGKAPTNVVKQMYGDEALADLSERLIAEFLGKALDEHKLDLALPPSLLATDLPSEAKDFTFEVELHLKPKITTLKLDGLSVEVQKPKTVSDAEVEQELEVIQKAEVTFADAAENHKVGTSDCAVASFSGTIDGVDNPMLKSDSHTIILGENRYLPDFEAGIVGMKKGETKSFEVKFPGDYREKTLAGKTATFTVVVSGVKERKLPDLNDDFAKLIDEKVSGIAELKQKIRTNLEQRSEANLSKTKRDAVGDVLVSQNQFEVSQRQVEQFASRLAQEAHQMMHQMGVPHEENEENEKALLASSMKKAERDIRLSYILEAIAKQQKFEVSNDDLEKRMAETAAKTGYSIAQIKAYYSAKEDNESLSRMDRLKIDVLDEKSLDYALSKATIKLKD